MPAPMPAPMPSRERADQLLVAQGLADSRTRAQALIMAGVVFRGEQKIRKSGEQLPAGTQLSVRGPDHPWVSRGGLKLDHALQHFAIDVSGWTALDIGASTGGFTDVLLARGAARVYAVDVGHNQLAWRLRQDPRVIVLEHQNARALARAQVPELPDIIVCDASFISLAKVLAAPLQLAAPGSWLVALIKPQFEAGAHEVGKGGIIRDPAIHQRVQAEVQGWLQRAGWDVIGITPSPITGTHGNVEFLIAAQRPAAA